MYYYTLRTWAMKSKKPEMRLWTWANQKEEIRFEGVRRISPCWVGFLTWSRFHDELYPKLWLLTITTSSP